MSWKKGEKLSGHYSGNPRRNEGGRHSKPCRVCGGSGKVWGTVVNRKTGSRDPHQEPCSACGGTGIG